MLKLVKSLLLKIVDNIDSGNSEASEEQLLQAVKVLQELTDKDKRLSKYQACQYLNVSRATFDNYVRMGYIPKGKHQQGFKELGWYQKDLDNFIKKRKNEHN